MACQDDQNSDGGMRVMICVDNSRNAELAFEYYVEHIHKTGNEVTIFHVSDLVYPTTHLYAGGVGLVPDGLQLAVDTLRQKNKVLSEKYKAKCEAAQLKHHVVTVAQGSDGQGANIVEEAQKRNVGLIIVGSRGLGVIRRTILGSISDYVIHHSHIPTLVCPVRV